MKIREILLCASEPETEAHGLPPKDNPTLAQKIKRMGALRDENNAPEAPASGNYYQRMVGRPHIPLK